MAFQIKRLIAPFFILSIVYLFLSACSQYQTLAEAPSTAAPSAEQLLRLPYVSTIDQSSREYFVYLPRGYGDDPTKKWPVMLFLHGYGERGDGKKDLDYVLIHGPLYEAWIQKRDLPFIMVVPQLQMFDLDTTTDHFADRSRAQIPQRLAQGTSARPALSTSQEPITAGDVFTDFSEATATLPFGWDLKEQDLLFMLDQVNRQFQTNPTRTYLSGISYGGFGTWYMASHYPERFAAIAPVVAWAHPELIPAIAKHNIPVWAFAGGRDSAVPKSAFWLGANSLDQLSKADVRFTIHEDMEHDAWKRVYAGEDLYGWLLSYPHDKQ